MYSTPVAKHLAVYTSEDGTFLVALGSHNCSVGEREGGEGGGGTVRHHLGGVGVPQLQCGLRWCRYGQDKRGIGRGGAVRHSLGSSELQ